MGTTGEAQLAIVLQNEAGADAGFRARAAVVSGSELQIDVARAGAEEGDVTMALSVMGSASGMPCVMVWDGSGRWVFSVESSKDGQLRVIPGNWEAPASRGACVESLDPMGFEVGDVSTFVPRLAWEHLAAREGVREQYCADGDGLYVIKKGGGRYAAMDQNSRRMVGRFSGLAEAQMVLEAYMRHNDPGLWEHLGGNGAVTQQEDVGG